MISDATIVTNLAMSSVLVVIQQNVSIVMKRVMLLECVPNQLIVLNANNAIIIGVIVGRFVQNLHLQQQKVKTKTKTTTRTKATTRHVPAVKNSKLHAANSKQQIANSKNNSAQQNQTFSVSTVATTQSIKIIN